MKGGDNIRGPQLERDHKNLSRVYELIKQGPEQYSFKDPRLPSYGPCMMYSILMNRGNRHIFVNQQNQVRAQGPHSSVPVEFLHWVLEAVIK